MNKGERHLMHVKDLVPVGLLEAGERDLQISLKADALEEGAIC
jgi:hypothetical protein